MKNQKVTICGLHGTGSGRIGQMVARRMEPQAAFISAGDIFEKLAVTRGVSALNLENQARNDFSVDNHIYKTLKEIYTREPNLVIDAHLAWREPAFEDAYKVLLISPFADRIKAIIKSRSLSSEDALMVSERLAQSGLDLMDRYWRLYGISLPDISHPHPVRESFDQVIDVSQRFSDQEIVDEILDACLSHAT